MSILPGGGRAGGGLVFRADAHKGNYYRLSIGTNGHYSVWVVTNNKDTSPPLIEGTTQFNPGATNTIAIVANGSRYEFYINEHFIVSFSDSKNTYSSGQIGFDADSGASLMFRDMQVWQ